MNRRLAASATWSRAACRLRSRRLTPSPAVGLVEVGQATPRGPYCSNAHNLIVLLKHFGESTMDTRSTVSTAVVVLALVAAMSLMATAATAAPAERHEHGHILLLDVETDPDSFPPRPISIRACIDLAAGQPVPTQAHHDVFHVDFDGGDFSARTGHVVVPTYPYSVGGQTVPWHDCEDFTAMFGL